MHVLICGLYGVVIYFSLLAYMLICGGPFWLIAACGPFIICAAMIVLWALDYALSKLRGLWIKRHTSGQSDART